MKTIITFRFPDSLPNPEPALHKTLNLLHKQLGQEELENQFEVILLKWGEANGYFVEKIGDEYLLKSYCL